MDCLPVAAHLSVAELRQRYRTCADGRLKTRWQALWLLARTDVPRTPAQVAEVLGYSDVWVRQLLKRWNTHGPEGLEDGRRHNGRPPALSTEPQDALAEALSGPAPDEGLWTSAKLATFVKDRWAMTITTPTAWRWMRQADFTRQMPRPRHPRAAEPAIQRRWQR
jgi:transposase